MPCDLLYWISSSASFFTVKNERSIKWAASTSTERSTKLEFCSSVDRFQVVFDPADIVAVTVNHEVEHT
jgi:hypothetical protein